MPQYYPDQELDVLINMILAILKYEEERNMQKDENITKKDELARVLSLAYDRCMKGKGRERHGHGKPFDEQPLMEYANRFGSGFLLGQMAKKMDEIEIIRKTKSKEDALKEILDVIVYASALYLYTEGQDDKK